MFLDLKSSQRFGHGYLRSFLADRFDVTQGSAPGCQATSSFAGSGTPICGLTRFVSADLAAIDGISSGVYTRETTALRS
jgi:hypothetical protein